MGETSHTGFRKSQRTRIKCIEALDFNRETKETSRTDRTQEERRARNNTQDAERP